MKVGEFIAVASACGLVLAIPGIYGQRIVRGVATAQHRGGGGSAGKDVSARGHVKPLPAFVEKAEAERRKAADMVARGQAVPDASGFVTLRDGKRVRYRLQGVEYLTVALIDFTDVKHGQLPVPNRQIDNSTYYPADVSPAHYRDMLFAAGGGSYGLPSMRDYYLQQSSGRFTWTGQVSNWVQVNATMAEYGANSAPAAREAMT